MSTVTITADEKFAAETPLLIIGAGAAGLCAALAAKEAGVDAVLIERDAVPAGSTALSAGLIPAAGTRFQRAKGIADSPQLFAADIQRKAKGEADAAVVDAVAQGAGVTDRMAGGPLRLAVRRDRQFQLSGPFGHADAWLADAHRIGTDQSAAQRRRGQRHFHFIRTRG